MTLYELTDDYLRLIELAETEDDPVAIKDTMDAIEGEIEDKADSYCAVIATLENDVSVVDAEIKRLQARKKTISNNVGEIKTRLMNAMILMNKRKIKTPLHSISVSKKGGLTPVVLNDGILVDDLPKNCVRVTLSADMNALRMMVENGDTRFAHYGEKGETIRIK